MKKKDKLTWEFNGEKFTVGDCITEPPHEDWVVNLYKLVFLEGKIYKYYKQSRDKVCLIDIYTSRPYWTKKERVFQVIKLK